MNNNFGFIDNSNISENCLNMGGLHLNPHGIHKLAANKKKQNMYIIINIVKLP